MNTDKSIKLMNVIKSILPEHYNFDFGKPEIDEVIKRLQMWEDLKEKCGNCIIEPIEGELNFNDAMKDIEQKYFPKIQIPLDKTEQLKNLIDNCDFNPSLTCALCLIVDILKDINKGVQP